MPKGNGSDAEDIEEEPPTPHPLTDTWMQVGPRANILNMHSTWKVIRGTCPRRIHTRTDCNTCSIPCSRCP